TRRIPERAKKRFAKRNSDSNARPHPNDFSKVASPGGAAYNAPPFSSRLGRKQARSPLYGSRVLRCPRGGRCRRTGEVVFGRRYAPREHARAAYSPPQDVFIRTEGNGSSNRNEK